MLSAFGYSYLKKVYEKIDIKGTGMKKILPLAIGIIFLSGCASKSASVSTNYTSKWVQPANKTEKCLQLIEGYSDTPISNGESLLWDGDCKDGKGNGLGKSILSSGAVDAYEIGFLKNGVSDQFYVRGQYGISDIILGRYIRENGKPQVTWNCQAKLNGIAVPTVGNCWIQDNKKGIARADNSIRYFTSSAISMLKKYYSQNTHQVFEEKPKDKRGLSTGTGFFISNNGHVLTNSHVIEGASSISIILNGRTIVATLVDHDRNNDIALLKVNEAVEGLPIELKKKTKQGTEITVLGYPNIGLQGNEKKATFGYINANSGIQGDTRYFQISSPIQPGNSGSPMVNDKGVVIGIASASLNQAAAIKATGTLAQNVNYAVKIAYALPMLINHGVKYIEPTKQKTLEKTELIERISNSVVLVVAE
tara:strand:+ start:1880 stop:3142 length:1263 start_codon:yes stop_codon:yes gene_type:complete